MIPREYIFILHGVSTRKKEFLRGWGEYYAQSLTAPYRKVIPFYWGYIPFAFSRRWTGFMGRLSLWRARNKLQKAVEKVQRLDRNAQVSIIAHSFGTLIAYQSMYKGNKFSRCFFDKVILLASVVSSRENFDNTAGHFKQLFCLYSPADEVARWNPWGHSGYKGFVKDGLLKDGRCVVNIEHLNYEHVDYINRCSPMIVDEIQDILGG